MIASLAIAEPTEIDVELIAAHMGAYVVYRSLESAEGHLLRTDDTALIVVDGEAKRTFKWRFVIAHELGHFVNHPELNQMQLCSARDLDRWYRQSGHEAEANHFASELLMPEPMMAPLCDRNEPTLFDVRELADAFATSLSATAIRFVQLCPEPCCVVLSRRRQVVWAFPNGDFRLRVSRAQHIPDTYAAELCDGRPVEDKPHPIDAEAWTDDERFMRQRIVEHSLRLGKYDAVLSLLWHEYGGP